jgi:lipid A 3-O-deacylase
MTATNTAFRRACRWLGGATLLMWSLGAAAAPDVDGADYTSYMRFDNDIFAGSDQGYSNGVTYAQVSPTVASFDDERLHPLARWLNRRLSWLQPEGSSANNMVMTLGQEIFTPRERLTSELIENDRPYAGVLLLGVSYNSRSGDLMRTTTLQAGVVGPSSMAEQVQDAVHNIVGSDKFEGWEHQLHDEPVFAIQHQRRHRWTFPRLLDTEWMGDVIVHGGGSLGNLATYANAGAELRLGPALPDNFGSAPLLPMGESVSPVVRPTYTQNLLMHGFIAFDVRYVLHDITLDGNTWKDSHSVEHKTLVADVGVGIAARWRGWKIALARYYRTREFDGQGQPPRLGSITIRREL